MFTKLLRKLNAIIEAVSGHCGGGDDGGGHGHCS